MVPVPNISSTGDASVLEIFRFLYQINRVKRSVGRQMLSLQFL